jgi:F-type H+-transporting ATPase subunit b
MSSFSAEAWVLIATVFYAIILYVKGRKPLLSLLDSRTARIKAALDEAEKLKEEAQALLAESEKKHRDALQTAQKIIDHARETADRIRQEAGDSLELNLKRRETQLIERIDRAESAAVAQIRNEAVDLASAAAAKLLEDAMVKRGAKLVDEAIEDIPARLRA